MESNTNVVMVEYDDNDVDEALSQLIRKQLELDKKIQELIMNISNKYV